MGTKNRERRKAKKRRDRGRTTWGAPGPRSGAFEHAAGPPPLSPEVIALGVLDTACRHAHSDDGTALAGHVARLLDLPAGKADTVDRGIELALTLTVGELWQAGWMPLDLVEHTRRVLLARDAELLADAVAADVGRYAAASLHPRWRESVERAGVGAHRRPSGPAVTAWVERHGQARADALTTSIELLAVLHRLPELEELVPPPESDAAVAGADEVGRASEIDPKVLARVRALLSKAESTAFPQEAEALSAKAQELMNRHAFERAVLEADEVRASAVTARRLWLENPYAMAKSVLVNAVATANRSQAVRNDTLGFVTVVGHETDLDVVELLVTSLLVQASRAMLDEGRTTTAGGRARSRSFRQSFLVAYAGRIGERLSEAASSAAEAVADDRLLRSSPTARARSTRPSRSSSRTSSGALSRSPTRSGGGRAVPPPRARSSSSAGAS